jgi:putative transposase
MYLFKNIADVQAITDQWMVEYNNERPHESLGNLFPKKFIEKQLISTNPLY